MNQTKIFFISVLSILPVLLFAGFSAYGVDRKDTVIFDLDRTIKDPGNFNWFTPGVKRMHGAHQSMWEPLFILNYETGLLEPWLGLSIEPNKKQDVWDLTLRKGIRWSDGETFDADDVIFTVQMALNNNALTAREAATIRAQVKSVKKTGTLKVRFVLNKSNPRFHVENFGVRVFSSFLIMPEHIWKGKDPAKFAFSKPIGTGPYKLSSISSNRAIWDRDDNWWGAKVGFKPLPQPKRLIWIESGTEENRAQLMSRNRLDASQNVTLGTFEAIRARNRKVIAWKSKLPFSWTDPCARQLEFNTAKKPWDNVNLRKALNLILNRAQVVNVAYEGSTEPSETMFVQYGAMKSYRDAVVKAGMGFSTKSDMKAGQELIEKEGWKKNSSGIYEKNGEVLSANITVNTASTEYTRAVEMIVEQFRRAGINAKKVPVENGVFWGSALPLGNYELAYTWLSCGSIYEPWTTMSRYTNKTVVPVGERSPGFNNTARWNTSAAAKYTSIVDKMSNLPADDPKLVELVVEAYRLYYAELPFIPVVQASKLLPYSTTYWKGWPTATNNYNHPAHWWGHTHQIIHNLKKAK